MMPLFVEVRLEGSNGADKFSTRTVVMKGPRVAGPSPLSNSRVIARGQDASAVADTETPYVDLSGIWYSFGLRKVEDL